MKFLFAVFLSTCLASLCNSGIAVPINESSDARRVARPETNLAQRDLRARRFLHGAHHKKGQGRHRKHKAGPASTVSKVSAGDVDLGAKSQGSASSGSVQNVPETGTTGVDRAEALKVLAQQNRDASQNGDGVPVVNGVKA
ncbi:hypothetical protein HDU97_007105 [Phlyctochytrium planicorne]|nr:hypothetical protein HDU97_007105 [Phlyctochytrium planicorne]